VRGEWRSSPSSRSAAFKAAIEKGNEVLAEGANKVTAALVIYDMIKNEHRDVICKAFVAGAKLTEKGALTYFYDIKRKEARKKPAKS
jgi:molybdenum cofactor biosynthesis enzyme